ncbi:MAG: NAD-dependent epimerase/dehydratase family protein [Burkholderiales bacterium]
MRIVVTGASGFVGRAVVERLSGAGHRVRALVREVAAAPPFREGVEVLACGDLARSWLWQQALEGAGALVHLAAIAHRSFRDEQRMREVNFVAARNAAQAAATAGARFVFLSSVKVLGEETSSAHPFGADDRPAPPDAYGRAKADAESALPGIAGLDYVVLRPPLVYGPGVKANFLSLMRAIARGMPLPLASIANARSMIYVGNLADAVALCVEAPAAAGRTYLVADGVPVSTPQLCRALGEALGHYPRLFAFPPGVLEWLPSLRRLSRSLVVDDSAIRRELGWTPPFTFEQGLRATAEWYLAQGR